MYINVECAWHLFFKFEEVECCARVACRYAIQLTSVRTFGRTSMEHSVPILIVLNIIIKRYGVLLLFKRFYILISFMCSKYRSNKNIEIFTSDSIGPIKQNIMYLEFDV